MWNSKRVYIPISPLKGNFGYLVRQIRSEPLKIWHIFTKWFWAKINRIEKVILKSCLPKVIFTYINHFQGNYGDFWPKKLAFATENTQFLTVLTKVVFYKVSKNLLIGIQSTIEFQLTHFEIEIEILQPSIKQGFPLVTKLCCTLNHFWRPL